MKEYTIYDNYDVYSEENMKEAKENIIENAFFGSEDGTIEETDNFGKTVKLTRKEYADSITKQALYDACYDSNCLWFSDCKSELARVGEGSLIAIANVGRWNGTFSGYKEVKTLEDVMYSNCDYERVFVDSNGDLRKVERHHDGSNSILYRYWKDITEEQKDNFLSKIYAGKLTSADITRYTRKAGTGIANVYGWKVRK